MNSTVNLLRKTGIEAVGISLFYSDKCDYSHIFCFKKWQFILYYLVFFYFALRADIVHLWSEQIPFIVTYLKLTGKPYVVEWTGSDIRDPKQTSLMGRYTDPYITGSAARHEYNINKFKDVLNISSSHILIDHIPHDNKAYVPHRLDLDGYEFNPTVHTPLRVAHCTSHRGAKGTDLILKEIEGLDIDFRLVENVSREEAIRQVSECDIVIGQMVWGEHGMQELESIAMGKPVLCYINHDKEVPVIRCEPGQIKEWIKYFIEYPDQIKAQAVIAYRQIKNPILDLINCYV